MGRRVLVMNTASFSAIILAAGYSSRMGDFKPLMRLNGRTLVEHTVELFRSAGIRDVAVVLGHRAEEILPVVHGLEARSIMNKHYVEGMFSSVRAGVAVLPPDCPAFFMLPVDIPTVSVRTVGSLIAAFSSHVPLIAYPVHNGRRGHPPLISTELVPRLLEWDGDGGLRGFLRCYEDRAMNVQADDTFILHDVDTPEDFERLKALTERDG